MQKSLQAKNLRGLMKATLKFNLPEDKTEFTCASKSMSIYSAIWEYDQWLRSKIKHEDHPHADTIEEIREKLNETLQDNGILLYEDYG